jgi:hypothetical protein
MALRTSWTRVREEYIKWVCLAWQPSCCRRPGKTIYQLQSLWRQRASLKQQYNWHAPDILIATYIFLANEANLFYGLRFTFEPLREDLFYTPWNGGLCTQNVLSAPPSSPLITTRWNGAKKYSTPPPCFIKFIMTNDMHFMNWHEWHDLTWINWILRNDMKF